MPRLPTDPDDWVDFYNAGYNRGFADGHASAIEEVITTLRDTLGIDIKFEEDWEYGEDAVRYVPLHVVPANGNGAGQSADPSPSA